MGNRDSLVIFTACRGLTDDALYKVDTPRETKSIRQGQVGKGSSMLQQSPGSPPGPTLRSPRVKPPDGSRRLATVPPGAPRAHKIEPGTRARLACIEPSPRARQRIRAMTKSETVAGGQTTRES